MSHPVIDYRDDFILPSPVISLRPSHYSHHLCQNDQNFQSLSCFNLPQSAQCTTLLFIASDTISTFAQFSLLSSCPPSTPAVPVFPLSLCSQSHYSLWSLCSHSPCVPTVPDCPIVPTDPAALVLPLFLCPHCICLGDFSSVNH